MSRLEYWLWGVDFVIAGIGYSLGGPYAGLLCLSIGGTLILYGLMKQDESKSKGPSSALWMDDKQRFISKKKRQWHKLGLAACLVLSLLVGAYLLASRSDGKGAHATPPRSLGPDGAPLGSKDPKIAMYKWTFIAPSENPSHMLDLRVNYVNLSPQPTTEIRHSGLICFSAGEMNAAEEEEHMKAARKALALYTSNLNQVEPGNFANSFDAELKEITDDKPVQDMLDGKQYIYFFLVLKARDKDTPEGLYGTTEYCGYFFKSRDRYIHCHGTDISYMGRMLD